MFKDEKENLQRIERELLEAESVPQEPQMEDEDYLEQIKDLLTQTPSDPMEDTVLFRGPQEASDPEVRNFANGYGEYADPESSEPEAPKGDKLMTGLTVTAILLTLGILGVLLRWLLLFLN